MNFTMKYTMKQAALAVALVGAFTSAQAANINLTGGDFPYSLGTDPTDANSYSVSHAPSSFSDIFTFNLTTASDTITSAVSLLLPGLNGGPSSYEITGGTLTLFSDPDNDGATGINASMASTTFGSSNGVLEVSNVAAGSYFWQVAGDAVGTQGGAYLYSANTAPIPEPETYALLLSGIGMLGFIGRRRLAKGAANLLDQNVSSPKFA